MLKLYVVTCSEVELEAGYLSQGLAWLVLDIVCKSGLESRDVLVGCEDTEL